MRYKTFRTIVLSTGALGAAVGVLFAVRNCSHRDAQPRSTTQSPHIESTQTSTEEKELTAAKATGPLRQVDRELLARARQPVTDGKLKDAFPGRPFKVNLYQDPGHDLPNRAKVDLDRDDKFDEQWKLGPAGVKREISPNDDEHYTVEVVLSGDRWLDPTVPAPSQPVTAGPATAKGEASATKPAVDGAAVPTATAGEGTALRPMDQEILARCSQNISGEKVQDAFPGRPFKVNLYRDPGKPGINRLKIDLDRDDHWDEKWTFERAGERDEVKREVAPADDDVYIEHYRLRAGQWVRK